MQTFIYDQMDARTCLSIVLLPNDSLAVNIVNSKWKPIPDKRIDNWMFSSSSIKISIDISIDIPTEISVVNFENRIKSLY